MCRWVHAHLRLLWCVVYANVALLAVCIVIAAARRFSTRAEAVPTIPVRSMPLATLKLDVLVAVHLLERKCSFALVLALISCCWRPAGFLVPAADT